MVKWQYAEFFCCECTVEFDDFRHRAEFVSNLIALIIEFIETEIRCFSLALDNNITICHFFQTFFSPVTSFPLQIIFPSC